MKWIFALAASLILGGWTFAASASAQTPGQPLNDPNSYQSPPLSPYLLMLPQSTSTGGTVSAAPGTYQALVRPMLEARDERARESISPTSVSSTSPVSPSTRPSQTNGFSTSVRPTGHAATFLNTSHYYPTQHK